MRLDDLIARLTALRTELGQDCAVLVNDGEIVFGFEPAAVTHEEECGTHYVQIDLT